jgi:UDP-glucose 4-epimerase
MKALVTGGAGFIGHHLTRTLLERGDEVTIIDDLSTGDRSRLDGREKFVEGDIRDRELVEKIFEEGQFDFVFHTAARARIQPSIQDPITTHDVNVTGTLNLLYAASKTKVKRFVYSSSSSVYGLEAEPPFVETMQTSPSNPYAMHKWMSEEYCRLFSQVYDLDTVCLRYFNVYGSGMIDDGAYRTVISIFLGQRDAGEKLTVVGDGSMLRDFTHVEDIVAGNLTAADHDSALDGGAFNLGYGSSVSVRDVAERILASAGKTWEEGVESIPERAFEVPETRADHGKAHSTFGWKPSIPFEKGLSDLL